MPGTTRHSGYFECRGERIAAHCFTPAGPPAGSVFLLHGYYDHVGLYQHPIRWCLEHGFTVLAWDLPGHGLSTGPRATIRSFDRYRETVEAVLQRAAGLPAPWHCIGQSTGAAVFMEYLFQHRCTRANSPFQQVVLFAPLVRPAGWGPGEIAYRLVHRWIDGLPRKFKENSDDAEFLDFLAHRDPLQARRLPVQWLGAMREWMHAFLHYPATDISPLIIQGMQDQTVDWRFNLSVLREKFDHPEEVYLPDARHHLANESAANRALLFARLNERFGF